MSPLSRPFSAYRRRMQMSRVPLFVFVEGKKTDTDVYGLITDSVCGPKGIQYKVVTAKELSGNHGGKEVLLSFFAYLKRRSSLADSFKGKKTVTVIFLDKDVDDLQRKQRRSSHIVYTHHYDILNHVFLEGNLGRAISAAASLSPPQLKSELGDCTTLLSQLSHKWKEWVALCLFNAKKKVPGQPNYRRTSTVNSPLCGPLDATLHDNAIHATQTALTLTPQQFTRAFRRVSKFVEATYNAGLQDTIFKGKWYSLLLAAHIRQQCPGSDCNGLEQRLPSCFAVTLDVGQPWADHFKNPIAGLIQNL